jgi:SAM-dependent methyltransferase
MHKRSDDPAVQQHFDDYYYRVGRRAVEHIKAAMLATGKAELHRILDLPCGHGRVLRYLREAFPDAELVACDIDRDGVDFCAAEFGATPIYSVEDPGKLDIEGRFDLIWCGSLFTHLDRGRWPDFLDLFDRLLSPDGILFFTTEARYHAMLAEDEGDPLGMVDEFRRTGFAYRDYPDQAGYGRSLSSPAWVCAFLERWPSLELVTLRERGISQDVYALTVRK